MVITIPLGTGSKWEDNELKYFLRSIDKYFHIPYEIKIYAQQIPSFINKSKIKYQIVDRYYPQKALRYHRGTKHYENYFDTMNKLKLMSEDEDVSEYFFYCYDDMILLKPIFLVEEIEKWYAIKSYYKNKKRYDKATGKWSHTVKESFRLCKNAKYDYETHLPRFYSKSLLREMFNKFPIDNQNIAYAPHTLYGNLFIKKPDGVLEEKNDVKVGYYGTRTYDNVGACPGRSIEAIDNDIKDKLWLNYNDKGLRNSKIKEWLKKNFPDKSRFEL